MGRRHLAQCRTRAPQGQAGSSPQGRRGCRRAGPHLSWHNSEIQGPNRTRHGCIFYWMHRLTSDSGLRGCRITGRDGFLGTQTPEAINRSAHCRSADWLRQPYRSICRPPQRPYNTVSRCLWHEGPIGEVEALLRPATSTRMDRRSFDRPAVLARITASTSMFCDVGVAAMNTVQTVPIYGCVGVLATTEEHQGWPIDPGDMLSSRHLSRRPDRQLQDLAQRRQIFFTWPTMIGLPEVYACRADADLFGNFCDRQTTLDASVTKKAGKVWLTRQLRCLLLGSCECGENLMIVGQLCNLPAIGGT